MTITIQRSHSVLTLFPEGRLDTSTVSELEDVLTRHLDDVRTLVLDLGGLEHLSSAGLRVILAAQKRMNYQGQMIVRNVPPLILDIFSVTGYIDILTIE